MKEHTERFVDNVEMNVAFEPISDEYRIVKGYASVEGIDLHGHNIPISAMKEPLTKFLSNEMFRNLMINHDSTQVGVILDEFEGEKTCVDDKGIFFIAQIRDDIKTANNLWKLIQDENKDIAVSMKFEMLEKEYTCDEDKCWTNITKFNIIEFSLVEKGANPNCLLTETEAIKKGGENMAETEVEAAKWTRKYINSLPDSSFAYIEPCYKRGDTKNKNARHLPYKDKNGKIDLPHLRNALARVNQIKPICPDTDREEAIATARKVLEAAAKKAGIGDYSTSEASEPSDTDMEDDTMEEETDVEIKKEEAQEVEEMSVAELKEYVDEKLNAILEQIGELTQSIASIKDEMKSEEASVEDDVEKEDELAERVEVVEKALGDVSLKLEEMDNSEMIENLKKSIDARDKLISEQKEMIESLTMRVEELENEPTMRLSSTDKVDDIVPMRIIKDRSGTVTRIK